MSVYTIELGTLIQSGYDIGLADYPVPSYLSSDTAKQQFRDALNKKIINHYRFNEICCIPPDRFKQFLNNTMNEIMPVKNLLYDALAGNWEFYTGGTLEEIIGDTGNTTNENSSEGKDTLTKSGVDTVGNITNSNNSNNSYMLNVASDTPGQMLNIESDIANNTYASTATKNKSNGTSTGNSTSTDTTTYNSTDTTTRSNTTTGKSANTYERHRTVTGLNGQSYAKLFKEYQEAIRNVDMEVINALGTCFMSVF